MPADRNNHAFHVRHFISSDRGHSWKDKGALVASGMLADGSDARNVWSGSAARLGPTAFLFSHTGIRQPDAARPFIQSINVAPCNDLYANLEQAGQALICPIRDYTLLIQAGYYMAQFDQLGHASGEGSGPIMALRDPFVFPVGDSTIHIFFSAKVAPKTPAIGHATLSVQGRNVHLDQLLPPIALPDADTYTQAELPKIYYDEKRDLYYLLISACDRLYEGQADDEVHKQHRLYKSTALNGPWAPYHKAGSLLPGLDGLFGASLIKADFDTGEFTFIAPYTEMTDMPQQLTFAPPRTVNIYKDPAEIAEKFA